MIGFRRLALLTLCLASFHVGFWVFHHPSPLQNPRPKAITGGEHPRPKAITGGEQPSPKASVKKEWRLDRTVCSGLGDRMCLVFAMAGLGRLANAHIHIRWCEDGDRQYSLDALHSLFALPKLITLVPASQFANRTLHMPDIGFENTEIPATAGFDCVYPLAPKTFLAPEPINGSFYTRAYKAAGLDFVKKTPPAERGAYVVLHVRGGDKSTGLGQYCTQEALRAVQHRKVVVISDDASLAAQITGAAHASANDVYADFGLLLDAAAIIQHSPDGWSAFSSSVSMFRSIPLINTWRGPFNRIHEFRQRGGNPYELHTCNELDRFVAAI